MPGAVNGKTVLEMFGNDIAGIHAFDDDTRRLKFLSELSGKTRKFRFADPLPDDIDELKSTAILGEKTPGQTDAIIRILRR